MPRPKTGQIVERGNSEGRTYALRFTAYGRREYVTLGSSAEGWTRAKAAEERANILADVRRGTWRKGSPEPVKPEPTFHEFASEWLATKEPELNKRTVDDYRWALELHLLPFFKDHRLSQISISEVDRYGVAALSESHERRAGIEAGEPMRGEDGQVLRPFSASTVNKTLTRLAQILGAAVEYELIPSNPATGRRRRLKAAKPNRPHVEPEQLPAVLDAAAALENSYRGIARPILATLIGAGLRIGEALALDWGDVNLGSRSLRVASKTDAGAREIDLTPALAEELATLKARSEHVAADEPVFASLAANRRDRTRPARFDRHQIRKHVLAPAVEAANAALLRRGIEPMGHVTLHGLRRTYASLRFALGDDPVWVSQQLGHEQPTFSMSVYARAVKRRAKLSGPTLEAFDAACEWAEMDAEKAPKGTRREVALPGFDRDEDESGLVEP